MHICVCVYMGVCACMRVYVCVCYTCWPTSAHLKNKSSLLSLPASQKPSRHQSKVILECGKFTKIFFFLESTLKCLEEMAPRPRAQRHKRHLSCRKAVAIILVPCEQHQNASCLSLAATHIRGTSVVLLLQINLIIGTNAH